MPIGKPDDGFNPNALSSNQTDVGSGIDRLLMGGGSVFRAGRVIWATGFENGQVTDYSIGADGTGASVPTVGNSFQAFPAWQGNYYHLLQTDAVINHTASLFKYFPATIQTGQWGLEAMVRLDNFNDAFDIILKKVGPTGIPGSQTFQARIRVLIQANNSNIFLQYQDAAGVMQLLANISNIASIGQGAWYNAKLVVNFQTGKYVRFYWNNQPYNLSAIPMQASAQGVDEKSSAQFVNTALTAAAVEVGLDNVILTADEP